MQHLKKEPEDPDDPSSSYSQKENDLLQQIMHSQDIKDILLSFQSLSQGKREELAHVLSTLSSELTPQGDNGDLSFSASASQILKVMMTPATETLPQLSNLSQELKHPISNNFELNESHFSEKPAKKARIESSENSILSESNHNNSVSPFQALYNLNCVDHDPKTVAGIVSNIRDQYAQAIRVVNEKVAPTVDSTATAPGELSQTTTSLATLMNGPRLRTFLIPQEKGRSKNFDYVGGTITEDPDSEYFVFCRGRPTLVPFTIGVENFPRQQAKLKVQVMFTKIQNKVPIRCSNHKEGDNTIWRDQLMISTDPSAQSLSYPEGHGFVISPIPDRCDLLFLCRNSCRQGSEKEWQLVFTLTDSSGKDIAIRQMGLRVCEVPHRDIVKSKVRYEWNSASQLDNPVMKILPFKEEIKPEYIFPRVVTDVYPIYVSGYDAYCEMMQYVSSMEMRKKAESPVISHAAEHMRDWNRTTPIIRFLQPICGVQTSVLMEKFNKKDIRTLGDLYHKFTPDFFMNLQISPVLASQLGALYLNWRNIIEYYEMSLCKRDPSAL